MSITCPNTGCGYTVEGSDLKHCPRCGSYLPPAVVDAADPLIGQPIVGGKFRILSVLGEGGMGKVYKGMQKLGTAERMVAIKTLQPDLAQDPQIVARFHRETETVVQLEHPNTIKFFDFGELPDGKLFVAMEFIQGESLAHVIARGPMSPQKVEHILQQVCGSLAEAHEHGIVHRDLKPENIILTQKGQKGDFVKVLDFGIAKRNEADDAQSAKLTRQGMVLGTPPYMSPEQFTGQSLQATSDIYSLAVMTYEMLTGVLPYTASTPWEWATRHLTGQPTPFEQQPNGASIPPKCKAAVMKALSRNPADRPKTTIEFLQMFSGDANAGNDWAQSTSTSQGYNPGPSTPAVQPTPTPMPTPMPFGQPTPVPMTTTAGPQPGYNPTVAANFGPNNPFGQVTSSPGFVPAPSNAGFQAINAPPSNPGFNQMQSNGGFGQPMYSNPGYSNQGAPQPASSGGAGKIVAIVAVVFVMLAGAGFVAVKALGDDNNNNGNNSANNNNGNNGNSNNNNGNSNNGNNGNNVGTNGNNGNNGNGMNPIPTPQNQMNPIPTPQNQMNPIPTPQNQMNPIPTPQQTDPTPPDPTPQNNPPPRPRCPGSASRIDDLILNGNCSRAQAMFRAMRAAGCSGGAGDSFGSACPLP